MGRWLNYDELENSLSLEELIATVNAIREKEERERKFTAAVNGIDVDATEDEASGDIVKVKGVQAQQEGFGIGAGLGYMEIGA